MNLDLTLIDGSMKSDANPAQIIQAGRSTKIALN
jgi:hypothetical protein